MSDECKDRPSALGRLNVQPASPETFAAIGSWRYEPPYDFYDGDQESVLSPERYFEAVNEDGALVGFYYFEQRGDVLEIGLGLRPDLTGGGAGLDFFCRGLEFGRAHFAAPRIVLNVAAFNVRAIRVYERAGFRETGRHIRRFDRWGEVEFMEMEETTGGRR